MMSTFGGYEEHSFIEEFYDFIPHYASRPDLGFYLDFSHSAGGKVLELGCGTGRVQVPPAATKPGSGSAWAGPACPGAHGVLRSGRNLRLSLSIRLPVRGRAPPGVMRVPGADLFGSLDGSPLVDDSPEMVFIADESANT